MVVGVLLLTRPGNDEPDSLAFATATAGATESVAFGTATGQVSPTPTAPPTGAPSPTTPPGAASTSTATEESTPTQSTVPPTGTPTESAEPTATIEDEVDPDPTATDGSSAPEEPDPTATFPPTVGDFGALPPAQIVSGGTSRRLDLDMELGVSLDSVPASGTVYRIDWGAWTADQAAAVASRQGIAAPVTGSSGNFQAVDQNGELYFSGNVVQYVNRRTPIGGVLEDNATVIENARVWLAASGMTAGNIGAGTIVGRDDTTMRAVVLFKPESPSPLLAFYPSATVTIGPGGDVREANLRWPDGYTGASYSMRSGNEIWNDILAGEGSVDADFTQIPGSAAIVGTFYIYEVSLAYSFASGGGSDYLIPLVVFSGEIADDSTGVTIPASVYIQGVYGQSAPRG